MIIVLVSLLLPLFMEMYSPLFYYIVIGLLIPFLLFRERNNRRHEARFFNRWQKLRKLGSWINIIRLALLNFIYMVFIISISQYIGNGVTPLEIISRLSDYQLLGIGIFLGILALVVGMITWTKNEQKYHRVASKK